MSRQIQIRRGTAAEHAAFTGAEGEITMDTDAKTLRVHDGATAGGTMLARLADIEAPVGKMDADCGNAAFGGEAGTNALSRMGMPSARSINISAPSSGGTYTPPANGYVRLSANANASGQYIFMSQGGVQVSNMVATAITMHSTIPVRKGGSVTFSYNTPSINSCAFIYAEGAN